MLPPYAELLCRSNFSFLTGASHPEELVARAQALGYAALAITDEGSLAGVVRAHAEAKRCGLHLIVGAEMRLVPPVARAPGPAVAPLPGAHPAAPPDSMRLVLHAMTRRGYGNLSQWITVARRRAGKGEYLAHASDLEGRVPHAPYLAGLPDCLALLVPAPGEAFEPVFARAMWLKTWFGDRAGLGLVQLHRPGDDELADLLARVAALTGLPVVAVGDVLMHARSRKPLQDVLTATRLNTPVAQCGRQLAPNAEQHLRTRARLQALYPPEWLEATVRWAARCAFSLDELRYEYPQEIVPAGETPATWLRRLTEAGLARRYGPREARAVHRPLAELALELGPSAGAAAPATEPLAAATVAAPPRAESRPGVAVPPAVRAQVEHELALIAQLQYEAYFLTVADIVDWARAQGILCQGRGSAANSAVCFALGVTEVDPARMSVLFERFISAERNEPPDIDVDFEHQRREEVIQYLYRKYGRHRAALTAVVISYRPRSALRDVGRALGIDLQRIDAVSKSQHWFDGRTVAPERLTENGFDPASLVTRQWIELTQQLIGFPRHLSQHPGGFVIARDQLAQLVPVENAAMPDRSVIQWDKDDLDALGLLKVDILALGMLSAIRRALGLVGDKLGHAFHMQDVPPEDAPTYDMLCRGDSVGVFQVESRAQMSMLPRLKPREFYDLVIEVAIVRPGPIQGGMVHPYLRRRNGEEPVSFPSEEIAQALRRTLGVPIFQEQVMQLAVLAADFTPGEADSLRRAMAAWKRKGGLGPFHQRLVGRMVEKGYERDFAEAIFKQIQGFGEYGFPESHAASFALLVYVSAWLKRHHPDAFLAALLNSLPMGFYAPAQLVRDAREHGVEVRPPDVAVSGWESVLEGGSEGSGPAAEPRAVRLGLNRLDGFKAEAAQRLVAARAERPFDSVEDLARRAALDAFDLQCLAAANAMPGLAAHRHDAAWAVRGVDTRAPALLRDTRTAEAPATLAAPTVAEDTLADYRALGLTLGTHPLALLRSRLAAFKVQPAAVLRTYPHGRLARASGVVTHRQRPETAKGVVFVTIEDETGHVNVIVWPDVVERQRRPLLGATLLTVFGQWQREGEVMHLVAARLVDHTAWLSELDGEGVPKRSRDFR
jgi:error-prone DNA polymerase